MNVGLKLNGVKCLNQDIMSKFLEISQEAKQFLVLYEDKGDEISKEELLDWSFIKEDVKDDLEILICSDKAMLQIAGIDYKWWASPRRKKKLFSQSAQKPIQKQDLMKVSVATLGELGFSDVQSFEGKKKEVVAFMNEQLYARTLKSFNEAIVVFKLDDSAEWLTIEELEQKGLVKLK